MNAPNEHEAMSRVEELTLRLLDGEITAAEEAELERLVFSDPEAKRAHLTLLEQEAALRGMRQLPDLHRPVLERLQKELGARIEKGVMERIRQAGTAVASGQLPVASGSLQPPASLPPSTIHLPPSTPITPVEPDLKWLGSRRFWLTLTAAASLLLAIVAFRSLYVANRTAGVAEAYVYGQWNLSPGSPAAYRVVVRDGRKQTALASTKVKASLVSPKGRTVGSASGLTGADGSVNISFELPGDLDDGDYSLRVEADSEEGEAQVAKSVAVRRNFRVLVTADKPLYQPGQTVHIRTLALAVSDLAPAAGREAVIEVQDAKGNKVFRKRGQCSAYGIFSADFELADQVNTGDYTITGTVGAASSERSVAVKRYALPKFKVDLAADEGFYQPGQTVKGDLRATYTFGEPVSGAKIKVTASEFIEKFRPFASAEGKADAEGRFSFSLPLKDHFVGTDLRKGDAQVWLEATVTDDAGHTQSKTIGLTVTDKPIRIEVIPESGALVQGVENTVYIVTAYPDGRPAKTTLTIGRDSKAIETSELGIAKVKLTPHKQGLQLTVHASDKAGLRAVVTRQLNIDEANETLLLRTDRAVYKTGETANLTVLSSRPTDRVFLDVVKDGRTELMTALDVAKGHGELALDLPHDLFGTLELRAYRIQADGNIAGDSRIIQVKRADDLKIAAELDKGTYQPAEKAILSLLVTRGQKGDPAQAALSLAGVDEAVFALSEARPGLERVYFALQEEILKPRYELCNHGLPAPAELLQQEEPPTPQLEEATVALFSAAEGKATPQMQVGEKFGQRQVRFDIEREKMERSVISAAVQSPAWALFALTLVFLTYGIYRYCNRTPVAGASPEELRTFGRKLRIMVLGIIGGVLVAPTAAGTVGLVASEMNEIDRTLLATLAGLVVAGAFLALQVWAVRGARACRVSSAVPTLRKLLPALPVAFGLSLCALVLLLCGAKWHILDKPWAALLALAVVAAVALLSGALNAGGRAALEALSKKRWCLLAFSPALTAVVALAGGGFVVGALRAPMIPMMQKLSAEGMPMATAAPPTPKPAMPPDVRPMDFFSRVSEPAKPELAPGVAFKESPALKAPTRIRSYFPETLLWVPELITDRKGRAKLEIPLADSITTWRLSMSAVSARGELGAGTLPLRVFQDFFVDIDFPAALTQHDTVSVPVAVYNYLDKPQTVRLEVQPGSWFQLLGNDKHTLTLASRQVTSVFIPFRAMKPGRHTMTVKAFGSEMADAVERSVLVEPDGKPFVQTTNGTLADNPETTFTIPENAIEGASDLVVKVYPGAFSQVVEGLDNIFRMPFGCFEQTSSTTYPNVLVLDYLRRTKRARPEIEMKALNFINLGYQRLLTFEVKSGGFEWFGQEPASLVLTAYGLLEFSDMARVHDVDPKVIQRTRQWLESKQQANGSWQPDGRVMHEGQMTSNQDRELRTTAYISWALAEAGGSNDSLNRALGWLVASSGRCQDPYTLALAANALVTAKRPEAGDFLSRLEALKQEKDKLVWWASKGEGATFSRGECLDAETTALAAQAFLKAGRNMTLAHKALAWLVAKKDPQGTWYSTQATVQAMRALLAGTGTAGGAIDSDVTVTIKVNGAPAKSLKITRDNADVFHLVSLRELARTGENTVSLSAGGKANLACQIVAIHYLPWPREALPGRDEPLSIEQHYSTAQLKKDDILSCRVTVRYNRPEQANMTIVDLGLPPGFEVLTDSFQAMKDRGTIEQYSVTGRQVILYFREIPAGKPVSFEYRLRAKYPVKAKAPGASAYQYYEPAVRDSTLPVEITVL
jgi:uncharacterized protein YfaS (alpha-2-macroglobulin family)